MKATFPHMGNTFITAKALMDELGIDYVIPPDNGKKALEIGSKYAPEMACLPLKINIGNFIQAHEMGADTIFITGGYGPCRFGYYSQMHREILNDNGFNFEIIPLELPESGWKVFVDRLRKLSGGKIRPIKLVKAVKKAVQVSKKVDELEKTTFYTRPREIKKGETDRIYRQFQDNSKKVKGAENLEILIEKTKRELLALELDKKKRPLKVGIVGEIYVLIDSNTNFHIERILGNMGIEVDRSITLSGWITEHIIKGLLHKKKEHDYKEAAANYLNAMIGGHAQETVGNSVLYARKGYDGIIQLYPFTCMPEIVSESILPSIEKDFDIPLLTLILDEMTGEAGYLTRIEAFTDLLEKRKKEGTIRNEFVLSGN